MGRSRLGFREMPDADSIHVASPTNLEGNAPNSSFVIRGIRHSKKRLDFANHNAEPANRLPLKTISNETKLQRNAGTSKANWHGFGHLKFSELPRIASF